MPTVLIIYSLNNLQLTILQNIILFWKQIAICLIRCANESHEKTIMITTTKHNKTKSHTYLIGYTVSSVCVCIASSVESGTGGRFKNTYELLNLRALKISKLHKNHIFQCMGKIFCVEFQRVPLKFHTKYLIHTLKDVDFIHIWKFKSS